MRDGEMHTSKTMIRVLLQIISVLLWQEHVCPFTLSRQASGLRNKQSNQLRAWSWSDLKSQFGSAYEAPLPISIDSVLQPEKPSFSTERPTLFRERHGWCPYSERVWLTLELKNIDYDTIRIDNTGGPRPSYFAGTTPQMKWPDGRMQGESLDLVRDLDAAYADSLPLLFQDSKEVEYFISQFQSIFPRSRPSSRAAFLFQYNGEPLWRGVFEETLQKTDELLSTNSEGPFFCGSTISGADVAWAPFLERYRYQLPCLHNGLEPNDANKYSNLAAWYSAMDQVPAYVCRVKGDASSWRKVLSMAGFGNAFVPPEIKANMEFLAEKESKAAKSTIDNKLWAEYTSFRPYLADTPHAEAALVMTRNRKAISIDAVKRANDTMWKERGLPTSEGELEKAMMELIQSLIHDDDALLTDRAAALAGYLDERMCVPRDMGAMPAATVKLLARVKA